MTGDLTVIKGNTHTRKPLKALSGKLDTGGLDKQDSKTRDRTQGIKDYKTKQEMIESDAEYGELDTQGWERQD